MLTFKTEKISEHVTRIFAFATEIMYLVEGEDRAALLDTGSGFGSLKACVEQLTDKPLVVLMTHGHVDHAMGASEFGDVYMNLKDEYIYNDHGEEEFRKGGLALSPVADQIKDEDYVPTAPFSVFKDLRGGDSFDLGGVTIEIYDCPGHTLGSVVILIKEERALLLGDACNPFTFMYDYYSTTVTEFKNSLEKLKSEVDGKFDKIYYSHGDGNGLISGIDDEISVCDDIISGNTDDIPFAFLNTTGLIAKAVDPKTGQRVDGKQGNMVYNKDRI